MTASRRGLAEMRGFVFDLDGCVWTGDVLVPGAAGVLALLRRQGRRLSFLTNNSRARAGTVQAKLVRLGVDAAVEEVLTPLEILGEVITGRWGQSRVLVIGGPEMEQAVLDGGHSLVPVRAFRDATGTTPGDYRRGQSRSRPPRARTTAGTPGPVEG